MRLSLILGIAIFVMVFCGSHSYANTTCNPLLVLVGGGGGSGGSDGTSMKKLAQRLEIALAKKGITVAFYKNGLFTHGRRIRASQVEKVSSRIKKGEYSPVVVAGHSWGGVTALVMAQEFATSLVMTLDPVMKPLDQDLPFPYLTKSWINVYTLDSGYWRWGGARDYEPAATYNFHVDVSHYEPSVMYHAVEHHVSDALKCSGERGDFDAEEKYAICEDVDGCSMKWSLSDHCVDGLGLMVKLFGVNRQGKVNWYWPEHDRHWPVEPGGSMAAEITCAPGELVCYGASTSFDDRAVFWGAGLDGTGSCKTCCNYCRSTQTVVTNTRRLTCP